MALKGTHTYWGMVINNYSPEELILVQHGYGDYMREIIHTLEKGEEGTNHIQAWIRMKRDVRQSFMKKLYPRANFKILGSDEYNENAKRYAQKDDETTQSAHTHKFYEPVLTIETLARKVIDTMIDRDWHHAQLYSERGYNHRVFGHNLKFQVESEMVRGDYKLAKLFSSQVYQRMWVDFGPDMVCDVLRMRREVRSKDEENVEPESPETGPENICGQINLSTHTHTHTDEIKNVVVEVQPQCVPTSVLESPQVAVVVRRRVVRVFAGEEVFPNGHL